jgi:hypothetical protein
MMHVLPCVRQRKGLSCLRQRKKLASLAERALQRFRIGSILNKPYSESTALRGAANELPLLVVDDRG